MQFIFHTSTLDYRSFTTLICKSRIMQSVNSEFENQMDIDEGCYAETDL